MLHTVQNQRFWPNVTDLPIWGKNCERISAAFKKRYGFTEDRCHFLDRSAAPLPEEFHKKSNEVIESNLSTYRKEMKTAARFNPWDRMRFYYPRSYNP